MINGDNFILKPNILSRRKSIKAVYPISVGVTISFKVDFFQKLNNIIIQLRYLKMLQIWRFLIGKQKHMMVKIFGEKIKNTIA